MYYFMYLLQQSWAFPPSESLHELFLESVVWNDSTFSLSVAIRTATNVPTHLGTVRFCRTFVHYWKRPLLALVAHRAASQTAGIYLCTLKCFHPRFRDWVWPFIHAQHFGFFYHKEPSVWRWREYLADNDKDVASWSGHKCSESQISDCCMLLCSSA